MQRVLSSRRRVGALSAVVGACALAGAPGVVGTSSAIPPGMAYEKVTQADKGDSGPQYATGTVRSASDGSAVTYQVPTTPGGSEGSSAPNQVASTLGPSGWTSRSVTPPVDPDLGGASTDLRIGFHAFSSDLRRGALVHRSPLLAPGAARGERNVYVADLAGGGYSLVSPPPLDPTSAIFSNFSTPVVAGATDDLSHIVFEAANYRLLPDAALGTKNAYEWHDGTVRLVGILPDERAAPEGAVPGSGNASGLFETPLAQQRAPGVISADGSRIFFTTPARAGGPVTGEIYVRIDGTSTERVSVSQRAVPDPAGPQPATFMMASPDGNVALFLSCEKLTDDSQADAGTLGNCFPSDAVNHLYRYDLDRRQLVDLAPAGGRVIGVLGASADVRRVYFGDEADRIFSWEDGVLREVARLSTEDRASNLSQLIGGRDAAVTASGRWLTFVTSTDQGPLRTGGVQQVFLYDADADRLRCVTCSVTPGTVPAASHVRAFQASAIFRRAYETRVFDAHERFLHFETGSSLVPEDVNGRIDVYRHNLATGENELISRGVGPEDSHIGDISENGDAIFFVTADRVIPDLDRDGLGDVYVARVGAREHVPAPPARECAGDECQGGIPPAPSDDVPASVTFVGPDDDEGDAGAPVFHVRRLTGVQQRRWARSGRVTLRVDVSHAGRLRARAVARIGRRSRRVATATRVVRAPGTARLTLNLAPRARKALRRPGRLRVTVAVGYSRGSTQRATVVLRTAKGTPTKRGGR